MQRLLIIFLTISFLINVLFIFPKIFSSQKDQTPYWEPFELNPNLTLASIVKDGYRFGAMPCGQVQFFKTVADTTIQYEVGIDCKNYSSITKWISEFFNLEPERLDEDQDPQNPYYPSNFEVVKDCYQGINWRVYQFKMQKPNRKEIRRFIYNRNCRIVSETENWDLKDGGSFVVYNPKNALYFVCHIAREDSHMREDDTKEWVFKIISTIPYLDSEKMEFEAERRKTIDAFNEEKAIEFLMDE